MARVCFFRLGAWPLFVPESSGVFGGAEVRAVTFARAMARQSEHAVSFAVAHHDAVTPVTTEGIRVVPILAKRQPWQKLRHSLHRRVSTRPLPYQPCVALDADVIACFGVHDPTARVVAATQRTAARSVLFLTSSEDVGLDNVEWTRKQRRHRRDHHFAIRHADAIVVQTEYQQRKLREHFGRTSVLIRNPIELNTRAEPSEVDPGVLWIGRADRDSKRADLCLLVARQCPGIKFTMVMNDSSPTVFEELARDLPPNVSLVPHVPLPRIESMFPRAELLLNTSNSEGFPNTFLQAAKYGVPILSRCVDPDGMLTQHGCGLVAGSTDRLVHMIRNWKSNPDVAAMRVAAVRYVERHDVRARVRDFSALVDRLIPRQRAA